VNALAGAIFALYGETHQKERMKEFLVVSEGMVRRGRGGGMRRAKREGGGDRELSARIQ
jgi:hypothetical protein